MDIITFTVISDVTYASSSIMLQYSRHWMTICHLLIQHDSSERKAISGTIKVRHLLLTRCSLNEEFWCGPSWGKLIIHVRHLWLLIIFFLLLLQAEQWDEFSQSSVYTSSSSHVLKWGFNRIFNLQLFFFLFFSLACLYSQGLCWEPRWVAELFHSEDLHRAHSAVSVFTYVDASITIYNGKMAVSLI